MNGVSSRSGDDVDVATEEAQAAVAQERAGHEAGLGQHLEPVADAEHEPAVRGERGHAAHDRAEPGDDPGPQVVAVREAAGQDDRGDPAEVGDLVPQRDRLGARELEAAQRIGIAVAAREDDDADADRHRPGTPTAAGASAPSSSIA